MNATIFFSHEMSSGGDTDRSISSSVQFKLKLKLLRLIECKTRHGNSVCVNYDHL